MKFATLGSITLAAMLISVARADVESGPRAGDKIPPLKVFGVAGSVEGKEADFADERKDAPTVYLFVAAEERGIPVGGRPLARFIKVLDAEVGKVEGAEAVAVWLGDKAFDKHKEYLPKFQTSLQLEHTSLAAFDGEKSGPKDWSINSDAHLTVVIAHKGKVVKTFPFISVNEKDVDAVAKELKKAVGK